MALPENYSVKLVNTVDQALDAVDSVLADPANAPRTGYELVELLERTLAPTLLPKATRVYVPDAEGPTTPSVKEDQIRDPAQYIEPEIRAASNKAKTVIQSLLSLISETNRTQLGLTTLLQNASSKLTNAQALLSSSSTGWMRSADHFQDLSKVDSTGSQEISVDTTSGGGVTLAPTQEDDLSSQVASITISTQKSNGLPGDNLELASVQDLPGNSSPAAGSYQALTATKQVVGNSGGTGQEPVVSFAGDPDLHADFSVVLSDGTEYVDYERITVPPIQLCSQHGTAYVYDPNSGSSIDVRTVTDDYGWTCTLQNVDGSQTPNTPLVIFRQYAPGQGGGTSVPGDTLTLVLEMDLGSITPVNQIEITVQQTGGLWPTITGVEISLDQNQWYALRTQAGAESWTGDSTASYSSSTGTQTVSSQATGSSARATSVWEIPSYAGFDPTSSGTGGFPSFRYININFSQANSYQCPKGIGHPYYVDVVQDNKSSKGALGGLFGGNHSSSTTIVTRYPSPENIVNLSTGVVSQKSSNPGAAIGSIAGTIAGAATGSNNTVTSLLSSVGSAVGSFITGSSSETKTRLQAGEYDDIFQAFRQCVSLVRLKPLVREFPVGQSGQLVSQEITFDQVFSAVRLYVDDLIPSGSQIIYDISVDNGQTWQTLDPFDLGTPPPPYITPQKTLTLSQNATSLRFRASFSTQDSHVTPRLLGYMVEALPAVQ